MEPSPQDSTNYNVKKSEGVPGTSHTEVHKVFII